MNPIVKRLTDSLPLLSVLIILLGYLNLHTYYQFYDINIFSFLETSEIILSFGTFIFPLIFFFCLYSFAFVAAPSESFYYLFNSKQYFPIKWYYLALRVILILLVIGVSYIYLTALRNFIYPFYGSLEVLTFLHIVVIPLCLIYYLVLIRIRFRFLSLRSWATFFTAVLLIFYILFVNRFKYLALTMSERQTHEVILTLKDAGEVRTSEAFVFIGSTRNYFFFREVKTKTNIIVPVSEIARIKQTAVENK